MAKRWSETQALKKDTAPPQSMARRAGASPTEIVLHSLASAPIDQGAEHCVRHLLDAFASVLPGYALGVRLVPQPDSGSCVLTPADQPIPSVDGDRMFPNLAHERFAKIPGRPQSSFHCAADDSSLADDRAAVAILVQDCARALDIALRSSDALELAGETERRLQDARQMLVQTEKLASFGEIAAGLVHELTNPLTSVVAYAEQLQRKANQQGGDPDDVERLRRICEAADRMLNYTRSLISYARPSIEPKGPVHVGEFVDQALIFCSHLISDASITVQRRLDAVPPVLGAVGQLTQVFVNLITNACQAMGPDGGEIAIESEHDPGSQAVVIRVIDTGPGISAKQLPQVFLPFFTTRSGDGGAGLGLNIVRHIVEAHGGRIRVESREGGGAQFSITLPCYEPE